SAFARCSCHRASLSRHRHVVECRAAWPVACAPRLRHRRSHVRRFSCGKASAPSGSRRNSGWRRVEQVMIDVMDDDGVAVVNLAYGKANALDIELCDGVAQTFSGLRSSSARAVVLTGQGKMFSAGVDLPKMLDGGADYVRRFLPALHRLYDAVF